MSRSARSAIPRTLSRRAWLGGAAAWLGGPDWGSGSPSNAANERTDDGDVLRLLGSDAERAGLKTLRTVRSRDFLALGDAPERFLRLCLADCQAVALDYIDHFRAKGFDVAMPERRLTLGGLADERSYAALVGKNLAAFTGAIYNRTKNYLVLYDYREAPARQARSAYLNLRTLAHETTHQLTFNTGLLNRDGDVPVCIVEGLGMYGEVRKVAGRTEPGQVNAPRLEDLAHGQRSQGWLPLAKLLSDDMLVRAGTKIRLTLAYAESWLLVHYHMKEPGRLPAFRAYLKAIHARADRAHRLDDAETHLGDLDRLDGELRKYGTRLVRALP